MIFTKTTTYGLESKIARIQAYLNINLPWFNNVNDEDIEIYNKIQPTKRIREEREVIIPEVFAGGKDYKNPFINDRVSGTIGFLVTDRNVDLQVRTATLRVIFTVCLTDIHANDLREEERALLEAERVLRNSGLVNVTDAIEYIPDVFAGSSQVEIRYRDMQPWYVFAIVCNTTYSDDLCFPFEPSGATPQPIPDTDLDGNKVLFAESVSIDIPVAADDNDFTLITNPFTNKTPRHAIVRDSEGVEVESIYILVDTDTGEIRVNSGIEYLNATIIIMGW